MKEIFERRSIRKYEDRPVEREKLEMILEAGRMAPSGKNRQPWKYIVFSGEAKALLTQTMARGLKREMHEKTMLPGSTFGWADAKNTLKIMEEAPVVIAVINTNARSPFKPLDADCHFTELCDTLSIGASVENILLAAVSAGLGTLWIANTCFAYEELYDYIGEEGQLTGAIAVGYSAQAPDPRPRKPLDAIVQFRDHL